MDLTELGICAASAALRDGIVSAEQLVTACIERIDAREPQVRAWAHRDNELALQMARRADAERARGAPLGLLHGVPVGIKDVFDTRDFPTEYGTPLHAGRRPTDDATAVARLREAGAIVLGKTVTTELAVYAPGPTRNPHDLERTPGGSSSGSAAAVADRMVPGAIGTQTNGSVIRPASFCGVIGYKPSFGLVSRHGALVQSPSLDQVGVFGRSVEDVALLAEVLCGFDAEDAGSRLQARPPLLEGARSEPPVRPRLGFVRSPVWDQIEPDAAAAFEELVQWLGDDVFEGHLPTPFPKVHDWHRTVMEADLALSFERELERGADVLSDLLRGMLRRGAEVRATEYRRALEFIPAMGDLLAETLADCDVILTPAAPGQAPAGLASTGSAAFCTLWTFCGAPAITLPLLEGADGLPIGVQLVAAPGDDVRLLRTARWLATEVASDAIGEE